MGVYICVTSFYSKATARFDPMPDTFWLSDSSKLHCLINVTIKKDYSSVLRCLNSTTSIINVVSYAAAVKAFYTN